MQIVSLMYTILYFEKKKDYHIEILSIDRTSNKEHFYG